MLEILAYRTYRNLFAAQVIALIGTGLATLLGHTNLESTVRYLGIEVEVALELSEQTEI